MKKICTCKMTKLQYALVRTRDEQCPVHVRPRKNEGASWTKRGLALLPRLNKRSASQPPPRFRR
jgi:hypothetical protein